MFIEIRPYEKERLSVRFKAEGDDFSKILQAIKKVPNRAWIPAGCFWKGNDSELQRYSLSCLKTTTVFLFAYFMERE